MLAKILISPSKERLAAEIKKILSDFGLSNPHPDLMYFNFDEKLGIEQARRIKDHYSLKPYLAKGKAVVLENGSQLTIEAQNALLKTLEELPEHALFILGTSSDVQLLPTVISRCQIINFNSDSSLSKKMTEDIENLIISNLTERFEYIEKLKEKEEFLQSLVAFFHENLKLHPSGSIDFLKELLQAEEWKKQNVNIRAILEYLMLKMPKKESEKTYTPDSRLQSKTMLN